MNSRTILVALATILVVNVVLSTASAIGDADSTDSLRVKRAGGRAPVSVGKAPTAAASSGGKGGSGLGSAIATGAASGLAGVGASLLGSQLLGGGGR